MSGTNTPEKRLIRIDVYYIYAMKHTNYQQNKKTGSFGFTLAEMLIVVAIIGVLTATAVPIFSSVNERAREATDLANIRSAYAEVMVEVVVDQSTTHSAVVTMTQAKADWQTDGTEATLQRLAPGHIEGAPRGEKGAQTTVQWNAAGYLEIIFDGEGGSGSGGGGGSADMTDFKYSGSDKRRVILSDIARAFFNIIPDLKASGHESDYQKNISHAHQEGGSVPAGGHAIDVYEVPINSTNINVYGPYWEGGKAKTWKSLFEENLAAAGIDPAEISEENAPMIYSERGCYVYFNDDYEPVCISYHTDDTQNTYRYVYEDGTVVDFDVSTNGNKLPGYRQYIAYDMEYAKEKGTVNTTDE